MATSNKHDKHSEDLMTSLTALIDKGRREGVITNTELMAALEKLDLSVDKIERVYDTFDSIGIQIVSGDGEGEGNGALPELLDDVDADHVVLFDDNIKEIAGEIVRCPDGWDKVIIGLESAGDSLENDLRLLVSAHGIDYDTDHGGSLLTNISDTGRTARAGC